MTECATKEAMFQHGMGKPPSVPRTHQQAQEKEDASVHASPVATMPMGRTAMKASTTASVTAARAAWCRATMSVRHRISSPLISAAGTTSTKPSRAQRLAQDLGQQARQARLSR